MKCKGENCNAIDGVNHSLECLAEHEKTISYGALDTPGNRHPECRYRGYKGEPLGMGATKDEVDAWNEGKYAHENP